MKKNYYLFTIGFIIIGFYACKKATPVVNMINTGPTLIGTWQESKVEDTDFYNNSHQPPQFVPELAKNIFYQFYLGGTGFGYSGNTILEKFNYDLVGQKIYFFKDVIYGDTNDTSSSTGYIARLTDTELVIHRDTLINATTRHVSSTYFIK